MKKLLRTRPIWILVLSSILAAVLLTLGYAAIAKWRRADVQQTNSTASVMQTVDLATHHGEDEDPELLEKRREYLNRFYGTGPGQVSYADFAATLAAVRALPPSPLLASESGMSGGEIPETPQPWTYPLLPPLGNQWDAGGASVRIDAIAVHPTDPDIVYVASEGGLAKSTNGGGTWSYLSNGLASQSIRSIAIDPIAPNIIYAGTGTAPQYAVGMYRSFDSGQSWELLGNNEFAGGTICKILIDPATAGSESKTTLYASVINQGTGTHTLWKSEESGNSWAILRGPTNGAGAGLAHFDIAIDSSRRLYFTAPDGVFGLPPGGSLYMIHGLAPSQASKPSFLAVDNQSVLYLARKDGPSYNDWVVKIAKSFDFGDHWTELPLSGADLYCFGVDPVYPSRIFVGGYAYPTVPDLRYTLDGGNNWLSAGPVHVDQHAIAFCPANPPAPQRYYLGGDGGIHRADYPNSHPPSITFVSKNQNLPGALAGGVTISRDDRFLIGTQDNANQISTPANRPWDILYPIVGGSPILGGDGTRGFMEVQNNVERIYAVTYFFGQIGTGNGAPARVINRVGTSISPPDASGEYTQFYPALSVRFQTLTTDRVMVGFQNIWRSVTSGNSWTRIGGIQCPGAGCGIFPDSTIVSISEAPSDPKFMYAITININGTKIRTTSDAHLGTGATWRDITRTNLEGGFNFVIAHPDYPQTAYLATNSHVYKTTDNGATWTPEAIPANCIFRDVAFHPANHNKVLVASDRGIFAGDNGIWGSMSFALPEGMAFTTLSFNQYSHQLAASSWGRGVYAIDLDRVPPTAIVNFPANGAHVRGIVTVWGTALDNHKVADFQFKLDGVNLVGGGGGDAPDTPAPNVSVNWNTTASLNGNHVLTLLVHDAYGTPTTSAPVTVIVDNLAPTVTITEPEDGKKVAGKVMVSADASDNIGVAGVQFYLDRDTLGDEVTSEPFSISWDTTSTEGEEHTLIAVARDAAGNTTSSNAVTVKVSN